MAHPWISRPDDSEHAAAQDKALSTNTVVIRKLPVLSIPSMNLKAWYVFLPCGSMYYVGRYDRKRIQSMIDMDNAEHRLMQYYANRRM